MSKTEIILALAVILIPFIPSMLQWANNRRQTQGDVSLKIGNAYDQLLENLDARVKELETDNKQYKKNYRVLWGYMITLVEGYIRNGLTPPAPPTELETDPELARLFDRIKRATK